MRNFGEFKVNNEEFGGAKDDEWGILEKMNMKDEEFARTKGG